MALVERRLVVNVVGKGLATKTRRGRSPPMPFESERTFVQTLS
jgi:hypothetical protein